MVVVGVVLVLAGHSEARLQVPKHSDGLVAMDSKGNVCSMVRVWCYSPQASPP